MAVAQPPKPQVSGSTFWTLIDERVLAAIVDAFRQLFGVARPRPVVINVPLVDGSGFPPPVGWVSSVVLPYANMRIVGWSMHALAAGAITVDIQSSAVQDDPTLPPVLTSMPGPDNYPSLNGYSVPNQDTSAWVARDLTAGSVLSFYIVAVDTSIQSCVLAVQLLDLDGKVLQQ